MTESIEVMERIIAPKSVRFESDPRTVSERLLHSLGLLRGKTIEEGTPEELKSMQVKCGQVRRMEWTPLISVVPIIEDVPQGLILCHPDRLNDGEVLSVSLFEGPGGQSSDRFSISSSYGSKQLHFYTTPIVGVNILNAQTKSALVANGFTRRYSS